MNWHSKSFDELSLHELYQLLQLRAEVFVVEQDCPYQDLDGKDYKAIHLLANDAEGRLVAYCRLLPAGISYPEPSIGRVVNSPAIRNQGAGKKLMHEAIRYIREHWEQAPIRISAQCYLEKFYTELGFQKTGEPYMEDNIPHIEMLMP